jgi:hypothetical protein
LLTYTNLVLGQALAVTSAGSRGESDSKSNGDTDSDAGDSKADGDSDNESDGAQKEVPPTKRTRTKSRRVRFGQELTLLLRSFLAKKPAQSADAEFLRSLLDSQKGETFSSLCEYNADFIENWRTFATKGALFSSFRSYYFELRTSVK